MENSTENFDSLLEELLDLASRKGATACEMVLHRDQSQSCQTRLGALESLEQSDLVTLGLRVLSGLKQATVTTTCLRKDNLVALLDNALSLARAAPEDPHAGLADPDRVGDVRDQTLPVDPTTLSGEALRALAQETEEAALAVPRVTNSEGGFAANAWGEAWRYASNGLRYYRQQSSYEIGASVVAGDSTAELEADYAARGTLFYKDLPDAATIGTLAGTRAVSRMGARKMRTGRRPVVFSRRVSRDILSSLARALNGRAIAKGASFLADAMGKRILPAALSVLDDPHLDRGFASRLYDAEGLATRKIAMVDQGVLRHWFLDLAASRQLAMEPLGQSWQAPGGRPRPGSSNLYLVGGTLSCQELIEDIQEGFYVTSLMGMGVNLVNGEFSEGASGFWIEKGAISFPVKEMTIAGTLLDMFASLSAADNLTFHHRINAPTLRVDTMMVAGI